MNKATCGSQTAHPASERKEGERFSFRICPHSSGQRLDIYLVRKIPNYSRSALGKLIRNGFVHVDGKTVKPGYSLRSGELVEVLAPAAEPSHIIPERVEFEILYEDESLLVVVKPPGLVVHPGAGNESGTLVHGLLYHHDDLPSLADGRPGIVHRLDKDTSGIMLVAKTQQALARLSEDFRERRVDKTYHAILLRSPDRDEGRLVAAIGRHPVNRKKMAIRESIGRYAATRWRVKKRFANGSCFVKIDLETGRTHQIRVHMASLGCPVAGDDLYGGRVPEQFGVKATRQLLHASKISFNHPETGEPCAFSAPLWHDMQEVLTCLQSEKSGGGK